MGDDYITFTQINDFLYSPASLYLHGAFAEKVGAFYKAKSQVAGSIEHEAIEDGRYSSSLDILQAKTIYSERFRLVGKIDTFNTKTGELVERKNKVSKLYKGLVYQVWAQYFALTEMGYSVKKMFIYSKTDNKKYPVKKPNKKDEEDFKKVLNKMRSMSVDELLKKSVDSRGALSIYGTLSW